MSYKDARGAIPWKEGDELPEEAIRRLRNSQDYLDEIRDPLRACKGILFGWICTIIIAAVSCGLIYLIHSPY